MLGDGQSYGAVDNNQVAHTAEQEFVKYSFFKIDRTWRQLPREVRDQHKSEFAKIVDELAELAWTRNYSLVGLRADADLLIRQTSPTIDIFQSNMIRLQSSALGHYLDQTYSYLAMTRQSPYASKRDGSESSSGTRRSWDLKYFVVYPMVKKREWYKISQSDRQGMMVEHFRIGRKYPSVKINTAYSFGLDDQEFVVAFETDELSEFLHLVEELRSTEAGQYTSSEIPIFTSILMPIREVLGTL